MSEAITLFDADVGRGIAPAEVTSGPRSTAKHYTTAWVPVSRPAGHLVPLIILNNGQILREAFAFFNAPANRGRSATWFRKAARVLGTLYDFYLATVEDALDAESGERLLNDFLTALAHGTIEPDGSDPTGLRWSAISPARLGFAQGVIRRFCTFCDDIHGSGHVLASGRFVGAVQVAHAREIRLRHSKLYHLAARGGGFGLRFGAMGNGGLQANVRPAKSFPKALLGRLLFEGCRRDRVAADFGHPLANEFNITLMIAAVLLAGGGCRKSELFHAFAEDIRGDEVRLYHPEMGQVAWANAARQRVAGTRKTYLAEMHGLRPRHLLPPGHPRFCGWKGMLLDRGAPEFWSRLQWISPGLRELFRTLHGVYVNHVRPTALAHPYYLVSLSQAEFGQPWTVGAFNDAFANALRRIGEEPDATRGLNPHGLRHLYGQTLTDMRVSPIIIQQAMHHRSIASQLAYTKPSAQRVSETLEAASRFNTVDPSLQIEANALHTYAWRSDPLNLLAPWNLGGR